RIQSRLEQPAAILDIETFDGQMLAIIDGVGLLHIRETGGGKVGDLVAGDWSGATSIIEVDERLYFLADDAVYTIEFQPQTTIQEVAQGILAIHAGYPDIWAVDADHRLGRITDDGFVAVAALNLDEPPQSIASGPDGRIWLAGNHTLSWVDLPQTGADPTVKHYGPFDQLSTVFVDREGTLWLSSGMVLGRFLGERFQHFKLQTGAEPQTVWGITQDVAGRFWFATQKNLLLRQHDESLRALGRENGLPEAAVRDVVRSQGGRVLWAGVTGHGLFRIDPLAMTASSIPGTASMDILDLEVTASGDLWMATAASGVSRYEPRNDRLTKYPSPGGQPVFTIDGAADGALWLGVDNVGLARLVPAPGNNFELEALASDRTDDPSLFAHLRLIDTERAWVATEDSGVFVYGNGGFDRVEGVVPDFNRTAYMIEPLPDGSLVVGGEKGLNHLMPGESASLYYNGNSGFLGLESNAHATFTDDTGGLWIGTVDGASRMDTSLPLPSRRGHAPRIERVTALGSKATLNDAATLPNGESDIAIDFAAISLMHPGSVQVSYRLLGVDTGWSEPTLNRRVQYTRLPPGSHQFQLRARVPGGDWSDIVSTRSFTVPPKFWQQP
ncbi:MAG: triple tyrosine motif-containing protein, partial [Pseudomonadota bacterium]